MLLYKIRVTIVCMITWGCFTRSDPSINASCCYTYVQVTPSCVRQRLAVSPYSGCCYHSASSGGSCSACSSASSPCGNRRSWGPSGYQGNGPAEACSETSSQMDWWGGRDMRYHSTHIISYNNNNDKKTQKRCQDGTKETTAGKQKLQKHTTHRKKLHTRITTCNESNADRAEHIQMGNDSENHITLWNGCFLQWPPNPCHLLTAAHNWV